MNTTNTHINKMVRILPLLIVVILITSCKEKTSYRMQLLIENKTDNKIAVKLFPKSEYLHNDLYDFSDFGSGYNGTEHNIESNRNESLYYSENTDQKPFSLAAKIFDSIHITPFNKDKKVMKFSIDTVIGYSENLFDSISSWNYEIKDYDEPDNFNQNPVESHDYSFIISIDKY